MRTVTRSPIKWLGGKSHSVKWILPKFPTHTTYVEPFGGGASLLLAKPPADVEIYNDKDRRLVDLFRSIKYPKKLSVLMSQLYCSPYSRRLRYKMLEDNESGLALFIRSQQGFGGLVDKTSWGMVVTGSVNGMASTTNNYIRAIEYLPTVSKRLRHVKVNRGSWKSTLKYDSEYTLFYFDPPYVPSTRRDGQYKNEMSPEEHVDLVKQILKLKGYVLLSGYRHEIYEELEDNGWHREDKQVACMAVARTRFTKIRGVGATKNQKRTESLWISPRAQENV